MSWVTDAVQFFGLRYLLFAAAVFLPIEHLAPLRPRPLWRERFGLDLVYALVNRLLVRAGLSAVVAAAGWVGAAAVPHAVSAYIGGLPLVAALPIAIVVADLPFYAAHRSFHTFPWLWRFHAIHHSIEELDWLASNRTHAVDQVLTKGSSLFVLYALGFSSTTLGVFTVLFSWHSLLQHANIRLELGPLGRLIAMPHFHHWHHADEPQAYDHNFAGQLPLVDWIFGTLYLPPGRTPRQYGLSEPVPESYFAQLIHPFRRIRQPGS
jgi:sterol desaturase/sphingolipid hydroxylase (fatty acid hydroxylase superfamily)